MDVRTGSSLPPSLPPALPGVAPGSNAATVPDALAGQPPAPSAPPAPAGDQSSLSRGNAFTGLAELPAAAAFPPAPANQNFNGYVGLPPARNLDASKFEYKRTISASDGSLDVQVRMHPHPKGDGGYLTNGLGMKVNGNVITYDANSGALALNGRAIAITPGASMDLPGGGKLYGTAGPDGHLVVESAQGAKIQFRTAYDPTSGGMLGMPEVKFGSHPGIVQTYEGSRPVNTGDAYQNGAVSGPAPAPGPAAPAPKPIDGSPAAQKPITKEMSGVSNIPAAPPYDESKAEYYTTAASASGDLNVQVRMYPSADGKGMITNGAGIGVDGQKITYDACTGALTLDGQALQMKEGETIKLKGGGSLALKDGKYHVTSAKGDQFTMQTVFNDRNGHMIGMTDVIAKSRPAGDVQGPYHSKANRDGSAVAHGADAFPSWRSSKNEMVMAPGGAPAPAGGSPAAPGSGSAPAGGAPAAGAASFAELLKALDALESQDGMVKLADVKALLKRILEVLAKS